MSKKSANSSKQQQEAAGKSGPADGALGQQQATRTRPKLLGHVQQATNEQPVGQRRDAMADQLASSCLTASSAEEENKPRGACEQTGRDSLLLEAVERTTETSNTIGGAQQNICAACLKPIRERYLLMALEKQWHEDCLKCACCDCRLGEVGSSLYTHSNKLLCRRDFLRIFGRHGNCAACKRTIPPYELVMRANENAYHLDCFSCQSCHYRFCVGDRFHLTQKHKVICTLCHADTTQSQQPAAAAAARQAAGGATGEQRSSAQETQAQGAAEA